MSDVLSTDLYDVNMALAYLGEQMTAPPTFSLFVRDLPADRGLLVAAGLERELPARRIIDRAGLSTLLMATISAGHA
jgi:nicotinic acid phosphoribosyltransferase